MFDLSSFLWLIKPDNSNLLLKMIKTKHGRSQGVRIESKWQSSAQRFQRNNGTEPDTRRHDVSEQAFSVWNCIDPRNCGCSQFQSVVDQARYFSSSLWKYSADQNQETGSSLSEITWTKELWSIKLELAFPEKKLTKCIVGAEQSSCNVHAHDAHSYTDIKRTHGQAR